MPSCFYLLVILIDLTDRYPAKEKDNTYADAKNNSATEVALNNNIVLVTLNTANKIDTNIFIITFDKLHLFWFYKLAHNIPPIAPLLEGLGCLILRE